MLSGITCSTRNQSETEVTDNNDIDKTSSVSPTVASTTITRESPNVASITVTRESPSVASTTVTGESPSVASTTVTRESPNVASTTVTGESPNVASDIVTSIEPKSSESDNNNAIPLIAGVIAGIIVLIGNGIVLVVVLLLMKARYTLDKTNPCVTNYY